MKRRAFLQATGATGLFLFFRGPALDAALARMKAQAGWTSQETAAEIWLARAEWERSANLDPAPSLSNSEARAREALRTHPQAPEAHAILGLVCALQIRQAPARKALLLPVAQEHLKLALASPTHLPLAQRLRRELLVYS